MSLTHGAVRTLAASEGQSSNPSFQPVLQLIQIKKLPAGGAHERFRAIISDGQHYVQGMLATQLNHLVHANQIVDNTVVRVDDFMNNQVQGRTVIILLKIEVINVNPGQRFGSPVDIEKAGGAQQGGNNVPQAQPMYNRQPQAAGGQMGGGGGGNMGGQKAGQAGMGGGSMYNRQQYGGGGGMVKPEGGGGGQPYNSYNRFNNNAQPSSSSGSSSMPIVRTTTSTGQPITPISQLNMYQNRWTIRARVTTKSDVRTWSNAKGEGSLFSVELLDSSGMDIRATFFKEAVDKFMSLLEVDKVYTFSGGRLKVANMKWNNCKSGFEITFDQNAEIHLDNDTGDIKQGNFDFRKIADVENVPPGEFIDVLAVVKSVGQVGTILSKKTGQELTKCELTLLDDTGVEIALTVWGEKANRAASDFANNPVAAFRKARVSDFGGRSLSASGTIVIAPRVPETDQLRAWWQNVGRNSAPGATRSLSSAGGGGGRLVPFEERKTISSIKGESLGYQEKPDWISFKATFSFIKKDKEGGAWYQACPNAGEPCKNRFKVSPTPDGNFHCEKCNQTYPNCVRRFIFSATLMDDTSSTWVSIFNEQAERLFDGVTADEVFKKTKDENYDEDAYNSYFAKATFTDWVFNCKVKQEIVSDETRIKTTVYSLHPVDYAKESRSLLDAIAKF